MKKRAKKKATMIKDHNKEPPDLISYLPDEVLYIILSRLPVDDAVRSSILSKRWRYLWKQTSHLDFDVEHMLEPLTRLSISPDAYWDFVLDFNTGKGLLRYATLFLFILEQHMGDLTSCRFLHFPDLELETWIQHLVERKKGLKDLTLACEPVYTIVKHPFPSTLNVMNSFSSLRSLELICYFLESPSIFEACKNLRTLKLKDMHMQDETINGILSNCESLENFSLFNSFGFTQINIRNPNLKFLELNFLYTDHIEVFAESLEVLMLASITCPAKNLVLEAPNLRVFHCCSNQKIPMSYPVLRTQELLEYYSGLLESERSNIFWNLSSLSVDLDLNNIREAFLLSYILKSSVDLQTLKILLPVKKTTELRIPGIAVGALPYACFTFWEGRAICNCIRNKLRFVQIEGFTGMEAEVDFIKYLIIRCTNMKVITIVCASSMVDVHELLSLQSASANFSIKLKVAERVL